MWISSPYLYPVHWDEKNTGKKKALRLRSCSTETVKLIHMNIFLNTCKTGRKGTYCDASRDLMLKSKAGGFLMGYVKVLLHI